MGHIERRTKSIHELIKEILKKSIICLIYKKGDKLKCELSRNISVMYYI